ncbi:TPA: hypothetical protein HHM78_004590 [Escherichia coli]|uniref:hypothetical protein n=1 Tax=Escherichia coli TaxID=562 RepID=UPI000BE7A1C3|nr:hypothetical protein [Escherichia coli]EAB8123143.1 hypothetical protein [Escherichia coli]EAC0077135.1 hypothetical protein [Escherichia coli]EEV9029679.1 hypothetical protein [Escherichia coli]EFC6551411.1 hypothetical protein [Escherichia coli]EFL7412959.1 hypothetical protein [Escherichia coli]
MLKTTSALLFSAALFSTTAHAVIQDQQWGNWFGNISAMEFEINTQNNSGEVLTLTCTSGKLTVAYSVIELCCEPDESEDESDGDIGQLNAFFDILESEPESTERYQLTDIDGEDAFIRIGSIAMVRVPLDALEPVEEDDE